MVQEFRWILSDLTNSPTPLSTLSAILMSPGRWEKPENVLYMTALTGISSGTSCWNCIERFSTHTAPSRAAHEQMGCYQASRRVLPGEQVSLDPSTEWSRSNEIEMYAAAQAIIEAWRLDYNQRHPHSSLGHLTPNEVVAQRQALHTVEEVVCPG